MLLSLLARSDYTAFNALRGVNFTECNWIYFQVNIHRITLESKVLKIHLVAFLDSFT